MRLINLCTTACAVAAFCGFASTAFACSIPVPKENLPTSKLGNCSFENAGPMDSKWGREARQHRSGLVSQIVSDGGYFRLMVSDCSNGEIKVIWAKVDPKINGCGGTFDMANHLSPTGPIDIDGAMSVADLLQQVEASGFSIDDHFIGVLEIYASEDRIDVTCGCKLYYPDSPGAKL